MRHNGEDAVRIEDLPGEGLVGSGPKESRQGDNDHRESVIRRMPFLGRRSAEAACRVVQQGTAGDHEKKGADRL